MILERQKGLTEELVLLVQTCTVSKQYSLAAAERWFNGISWI